MNKYLILAALVLALGCVGTQTTTVDVNRGLTITDFTATPSQVTIFEPVLFEVEVANIGGTTARNAQVDFFGVEEQWRDRNGNLVDSTRTKQLGTLKPPEPARGVPGASKFLQDELLPPGLPQGITSSVAVEARVTYDYNTSGFIDLPAISEDEFRRMQINKQGTTFPVTVVNSAGPIHMTMDQRFAPIRIDTTDLGETFQSWPMRIILQNVGDGFPITPEDDARIRGAGGKITGTIEIFGPGAEFENCLGQTSGTFINLDSTDIALRIRESNQAVLPCTIRVDKLIWGNRPQDTVKLIFNLNYRYYVAKTAHVNVIGR